MEASADLITILVTPNEFIVPDTIQYTVNSSFRELNIYSLMQWELFLFFTMMQNFIQISSNAVTNY